MAKYARPDHDLLQSATSITGSADDPDYPAAKIRSEDPADPAKLTTVTGNWVAQWSGAVAPVAAILAYQYIDAGLEVRIQGNASNSWGSPSYNQTITIPAKRRDGPANQRWTRNAILLITGSPSYAFWRLVVVGTNSQVVVVGRWLLLSALPAVDCFVDDGMEEGDDKGEIVQPTELGVETVVTVQGPRRSVAAMCISTDLSAGTAPVQAADDFRALDESAEGRVHPFVFVPFDAEPWIVRFDSGNRQRTHRVGGYQVWPFSVREVSRGLPWP